MTTTSRARCYSTVSICALLILASGCRIIRPLEDRRPARPSPISLAVGTDSTTAGEPVSIIAAISFSLSPHNLDEFNEIGPVTLGLCLLPSERLLETAECDHDTVFMAPANVLVLSSQPLQTTSELLVHRGETVTLRYAVELTLVEPGGLTVIGVFTYPSADNPGTYAELFHGLPSYPMGRVFIEFR